MLLSENSVPNTVHASISDTHADMNVELVYHILAKPIRSPYLMVSFFCFVLCWGLFWAAKHFVFFVKLPQYVISYSKFFSTC